MSSIESFLRPGSLYFEQARFLPEESQRFTFDRADLPDGWRRSHPGKSPWTTVEGPGELPDQGWKVHVGARLQEADETLGAVASTCLDLGISFKYMPGLNILHMMERKYAPRTSAGKFITIYPTDQGQTDTLLERLIPLLEGREAAVPVTDVPIPSCPIGVRYGAFREHWIGVESGLDELAVLSSEGSLIPDHRAPRPTLPDGVKVPSLVQAALDQHTHRQTQRTLPYVVTRALHRSNGGGVYDARTPSGDRVVLKDGRRHTGLGLDGRDSAAALACESKALKALGGVPGVPEHIADFDFGDRVFLAMEYVSGLPAIEFLARHHPGMHAHQQEGARTTYGQRISRILRSLRAVIDKVHARGWSYGDLHPGNILIDEDDAVGLIDFETATDDPSAAGDRFTVAPGFRLQGLTAREADLKRIDLIHLWALCPENALWEFSDEVLADRVRQVRDLLPEETANSLLSLARNGFASERWGTVVPWSAAEGEDEEDLLAAGRRTLAEAVEQWGREGTHQPSPVDAGGVPWSLGGGMAGILWAMGTPPTGRFEEALDRLAREAITSPRVRPGLFTGRAGVALVLGESGHHEQAEELMTRAIQEAVGVELPGLESGLAGISWAALSAGRTEEAEALAERALTAVTQYRAGRGLLEGASGPALLALRLAQATSDAGWIQQAALALQRDIEHIVYRPDGTVLLDRGNLKQQPDLGFGSIGVGLTARHLHHADPTPELEVLVEAAGRTCLDSHWATQGLMKGRLGALAFLADRGADRTEREEALLANNLRALRRYFVMADGQIHFPGHLHLRFSHSLSSGLAGAVRVLERLRDPAVELMPGLDPVIDLQRTADRSASDQFLSPFATYPIAKEFAS